jgi:hypothetical protein
MLPSRFSCATVVLLAGLLGLPGCLALSFGGKSQQVDTVVAESPQTIERIKQLEARVEALEQQSTATLTPQLHPPGVR